MSIGQRIAQKRKEQGLSQEALGEQLGVSRQSIYKWESEAALPEIEKLIALSRLFGVSVGWLLGVEEAPAGETAPAEDAPKAAGELTETQLKMVEEIAERYIAAQPKPKPRRKWPWALAALALVLAVFSLFQRLDRMDQQYSNLQYSVNNVTSSVNSQISGISRQVEDILHAQNALTADCGTELTAVDPAANTATFSVYAVPKTYVEGMTVEFIAENGQGAGGLAACPGEDGANHRFSAAVSVGLTDSITLSAVFITPDGVRQTQLLDTYEWLYSETLPEIDIHDSFMFADLSEDGTLTIPAEDGTPLRYLWLRELEKSGAAAAADIRVGLFKNRTLLAWASPCEKPPTFQGFDAYSFFSLPDLTVPLSAGDELCVAAVITDEYGRVSLVPEAPYTPDTDGRLTWPDDAALDTDTSHWVF